MVFEPHLAEGYAPRAEVLKSDGCVGTPVFGQCAERSMSFSNGCGIVSSLKWVHSRYSCSTLPLVSIFTTFFNLPALPFLTLGALAAGRNFICPFDSLANLLAPCFAWTIIFLVSAVIIAFQVWRQKVTSSAFRWIDRQEATVVICLLLAQICSAANGAGMWPYVFWEPLT
jgi:hypothetical protein